jgi:tellurite resistance protein
MPVDTSLLDRVANMIGKPPSYADDGRTKSILAAAAGAYGAAPTVAADFTHPTGYDLGAVALFEAVVESSFLVAHADGEFDAAELEAFRHVVVVACEGRVSEAQVTALLADLESVLLEDGIDKRCTMVARVVKRPEQGREALRIAALLAAVSGGVSDVERDVLGRLATSFKLGPEDVQAAIGEAERALSAR